jgi:hypothetical protein
MSAGIHRFALIECSSFLDARYWICCAFEIVSCSKTQVSPGIQRAVDEAFEGGLDLHIKKVLQGIVNEVNWRRAEGSVPPRHALSSYLHMCMRVHASMCVCVCVCVCVHV